MQEYFVYLNRKINLMNISASYTTSGLPATGLSPVISGWTTAGALVISGESMTEVAGGFYTFEFTGYDYLTDYVFSCYASTLPVGEQYVFTTNDNDSQNNQGIIRQVLGLVQGNMRATNQTYVGGVLQTAQIKTYANASDCQSDINEIHTYAVTATYSSGNLTGYVSREV